MNHIHKRRLYALIAATLVIAMAISMILYALKQNINVFLTPSDLVQSELSHDYTLRLGGVVKVGSLVHKKNSLDVDFIVSDLKHDILVSYQGVLPDLFAEGKGVIVEGKINQNKIFRASLVLAKHDENYMPKNVYQAMRKKNS